MAAPVGSTVDIRSWLAGLPTIAPSSVSNLPSVRAVTNAGITPLGTGIPDFATFMQSMMMDVNGLIQSGKLAPGEQLYEENYGGSTSHAPGAPSGPPNYEQGADLTKINQLAYRNIQLGQGSSSLSGSGCLLASLTMNANDLRRANGNGKLLNLSESNDLVRDSGAFTGSDVHLNDAAHALGLNIVSRQRASDATMQSAMHDMQQRPNSTRLIVGVDYKAGSNSSISQADHYIAVKGIDDQGNLLATDPAGGRDITFTKGMDGKYRSGKYTVAEVSVVTQKDPTLQVTKLLPA